VILHRLQDDFSDPTLAGTAYSAVSIAGAKRFGIAIRIQCGITENAGIAGLSSVLAKALGQDAPGKTGPLLAAELGALGGFGIVEDGEAITIWGVCSTDPADIQETIQVVLSDLAIKPRIDDAVVQKARWLAMQQKATDANARPVLLQRALRASVSGGGLADVLNPAVDRRIDTARILAHHAKWFHPSRAAITIMGGFNPKETREVVRRTLSLAGWDERGAAPKQPAIPAIALPAGTTRVSVGPGPLRILIAAGLRPASAGLPTLAADILAMHYLTAGRMAPLYGLRVPMGKIYDVYGDVAFVSGGYVPFVEVVTADSERELLIAMHTKLRDVIATAGELRDTDVTRVRASYLRMVAERSTRMPNALMQATQRQQLGLAAWDRDVERLVKGTSREMVIAALKRIEIAVPTVFTTGAGVRIG
jgi:predicted Zn-dependent peptidase